MFWYKQAKKCWTNGEEELFVVWWIVFVVAVLVLLSSLTCLACNNRLQGFDGAAKFYVIGVEDVDFLTWDSTIAHLQADPKSTERFQFCVNDEATKRDLEKARDLRVPVTVRYRSDFVMWRWECNAGSTIATAVVFNTTGEPCCVPSTAEAEKE